MSASLDRRPPATARREGPPMPTRRQLLAGAAVAAGAAALPGTAAYAAPADLFPLGVASGDPLPDGVILWTRLVSSAVPSRRRVDVEWQVATDERFRRIVRSGRVAARP